MTRRTVSGLCLIASAACYLASQFLWPDGSDADTATTMRAAAGHPAAWTIALALESLSSLLAVPGAVAVSGWLRRRGRVLGLLGASGVVLACVAFVSGGIMNVTTLVAATHLTPAEAAGFYQAMTSQPYVVALLPLFFLGALGSVLLTAGAARGGLVPWWVIVLTAAGVVIETFVNNGLDAPVTGLIYLPTAAATVILGVRLIAAGSTQPERVVVQSADAAEPVLA